MWQWLAECNRIVIVLFLAVMVIHLLVKFIIIYHMIYTTSLSVWSQYIFVLCSSPSSVFSFLALFFFLFFLQPFLLLSISIILSFLFFLSVFLPSVPPSSSSNYVFYLSPPLLLTFLPFFSPSPTSFLLPASFLSFSLPPCHSLYQRISSILHSPFGTCSQRNTHSAVVSSLEGDRDRCDYSKYRAITLLSITAKVIAHMLLKRTRDHLLRHPRPGTI